MSRHRKFRLPAKPGRDNMSAVRMAGSMASPPCCSASPVRYTVNIRTPGAFMLSRRSFLAGSAAGGLVVGGFGFCAVQGARAAAVMTDDGFYTEPWFLESFLELPDE